MILYRRIPMAIERSRNAPLPSGPRCTIDCNIRSSERSCTGSMFCFTIIPAIPLMNSNRPYSYFKTVPYETCHMACGVQHGMIDTLFYSSVIFLHYYYFGRYLLWASRIMATNVSANALRRIGRLFLEYASSSFEGPETASFHWCIKISERDEALLGSK